MLNHTHKPCECPGETEENPRGFLCRIRHTVTVGVSSGQELNSDDPCGSLQLRISCGNCRQFPWVCTRIWELSRVPLSGCNDPQPFMSLLKAPAFPSTSPPDVPIPCLWCCWCGLQCQEEPRVSPHSHSVPRGR